MPITFTLPASTFTVTVFCVLAPNSSTALNVNSFRPLSLSEVFHVNVPVSASNDAPFGSALTTDVVTSISSGSVAFTWKDTVSPAVTSNVSSAGASKTGASFFLSSLPFARTVRFFTLSATVRSSCESYSTSFPPRYRFSIVTLSIALKENGVSASLNQQSLNVTFFGLNIVRSFVFGIFAELFPLFAVKEQLLNTRFS